MSTDPAAGPGLAIDLDSRAAMGADEALRPRFAAALVTAAVAVLAEPWPGQDVPIEDRRPALVRREYARAVLAAPDGEVARAQWAVATGDSAVVTAYVLLGAPAMEDADLVNAVATAWNLLAGA